MQHKIIGYHVFDLDVFIIMPFDDYIIISMVINMTIAK